MHMFEANRILERDLPIGTLSLVVVFLNLFGHLTFQTKLLLKS